MAKILMTGATGFVGKRLTLSLLNEGHEVYALCRIKGEKLFSDDNPSLHYIWGDLRNSETYKNIPLDIDAAYYLVHSMSEMGGDLKDTESEVVNKFIDGVKKTGIKQIIYLGGIINDETTLSPHLKSRLSVEKSLKAGSIPVTVLRASIIIGAGSASFEIIRDLCEKLPVMIAPRWVHSLCQPIAIRDVLFYLSSVLLNPQCYNKTFDIGGPEVLSFKELMLSYAKFRNLKRYIMDVPFLTPHLSSYWLIFITSVRFSLCRYLVESMKSNTVVQRKEIQGLIPHSCLSYTKALELAFQKIAQNEVVSTWMDSWEIDGDNPNIEDYIEVPTEGCLSDKQVDPIIGSRDAAIERIWRIGGETGYYTFRWAWSLRGLMDKFVGGVGLNRGRRHPSNIRVGDSIDFWRVLVAEKETGHLILLATMKVPGEAWLEFKVEEINGISNLIQTATFRPHGIYGRLYWYSLFPFHYFIFRRMAKVISSGLQTK